MSKQLAPTSNEGRLILISGASRSGKTEYSMRRFGADPVVFVFDLESQWAKLKGFKRIDKLSELMAICVAGRAGRYAFVPAQASLKDEYEAFCRCVWHFACWFGGCTVIAEELAELGNASKASGTWGRIIRGGMKRGIKIVGIIQSWAEGDKSSMRNASEYVIFRMSTMDDIEYMAKKTRIPIQDMIDLKPYQYLLYDVPNFTVTKGGPK